MTTVGVLLLMLTAATTARAADPDARETLVACRDLPANVSVPEPYRAAVHALLLRSAVLRRQCRILAMAPVTVRISVWSPQSLVDCRARASLARLQSGVLDVVIDLPFDRDVAELLAHEFEHVIEQLEGVDLRQRATERHSGVRRVSGDAFETDRAKAAGRAAAREVADESQAALVPTAPSERGTD